MQNYTLFTQDNTHTNYSGLFTLSYLQSKQTQVMRFVLMLISGRSGQQQDMDTTSHSQKRW